MAISQYCQIAKMLHIKIDFKQLVSLGKYVFLVINCNSQHILKNHMIFVYYNESLSS